MILNGNARGSGANLARHLLRTDENDHVHVLEVQGFASEDVHEAFQEVQAVSTATKCQKYLFSLSLSPPEGANASEEDFISAVERTEKALGLSGQARVIVLHEKGDNRDRHAHAVWSRIDVDEMKAVPLPFNRMRMRDVSRDLFIEHGWDMPRGLINRDERNPLNYSFDQYQHAKRVGKDARDIKAALQDAWAMSDNRVSFAHALQDKGFRLAQGDRRGFVAIDTQGEIFSIPKWLDLKTKLVRERLGKEHDLPSVDETKAAVGKDMLGKMDEHRGELESRNDERKAQRLQLRKDLVDRQRNERATELGTINARQIAEASARQARFRKGLAGVWDWMRGESARLRTQNETEAARAEARDKTQRDALVIRQREQRQILSQRQLERARELRDQYRGVVQDRARYQEMASPAEDERRDAFKRKRRETSERKPRRSRNRGPTLE